MKSNWLWVFRQKHTNSEIPKYATYVDSPRHWTFFMLVSSFNFSNKVSIIELTFLWEDSIAKTLMLITVTESWSSEILKTFVIFFHQGLSQKLSTKTTVSELYELKQVFSIILWSSVSKNFFGYWFLSFIELLILRNWSFDIFRQNFSWNFFAWGAVFDENIRFCVPWTKIWSIQNNSNC